MKNSRLRLQATIAYYHMNINQNCAHLLTGTGNYLRYIRGANGSALVDIPGIAIIPNRCIELNIFAAHMEYVVQVAEAP